MAFTSKCDANISKTFQPSLGPMGRSVDDCVLIMRAAFGNCNHDPFRNIGGEFNLEAFNNFGEDKNK